MNLLFEDYFGREKQKQKKKRKGQTWSVSVMLKILASGHIYIKDNVS